MAHDVMQSLTFRSNTKIMRDHRSACLSCFTVSGAQSWTWCAYPGTLHAPGHPLSGSWASLVQMTGWKIGVSG